LLGYNLQPLRLGACNLCGLFAFAHDTKDGSKFIILFVAWCACWWLPACLGACVLLVGVLGRFVVGGYLHALELVSCWLVCLVGSWLPAYLGACVLLVGAW